MLVNNPKTSINKIFLLIIILITTMNAQQKYSNRDEIPEKYKWNFSDIYADWDAWQAGYDQLEKMMGDVAALKGTLSKSSETLLHALKFQNLEQLLRG